MEPFPAGGADRPRHDQAAQEDGNQLDPRAAKKLRPGVAHECESQALEDPALSHMPANPGPLLTFALDRGDLSPL
jgi:hypothetical protein